MVVSLIKAGSCREFVDKPHAIEITKEWYDQIQSTNLQYIEVKLAGKSYTPEAAQVISDFFTSNEHFEPCLATYVVSLDLSDVIAGQKSTEDGLQVLQILAQAFVLARNSLERHSTRLRAWMMDDTHYK